MNYLRYWGLRASPFYCPPFFSGTAQRQVTAFVESAITGGKRHVKLYGSPLSGKTTVLRHLARSQGFGDCAVDSVLTRGDAVDSHTILRSVAIQLGTTPNELPQVIAANANDNVQTVWFVDDCGVQAESLIRRMTAKYSRTTVIAVARDSARDIGGESLSIKPLAIRETKRFLQRSLRAVSGDPTSFSASAIDAIHVASQGQIGAIAMIADQAMISAAAKQRNRITTADVIDRCDTQRRAA